MFKPLSIYMGWCYTRAKRKNHFISFIALIAIGGIVLGMTALITVLSVMNGFQKELREQILGLAPHIMITGYDRVLDNWQPLQQRLSQEYPQLQNLSPLVDEQGMLSSNGRTHFVGISGIDPNNSIATQPITEHMLAGSLDHLQAGKYGVVIGKRLARYLRLQVGDSVLLVSSANNMTPAGIIPRTKRFTVVGIYSISRDYDFNLAFMHIADAQTIWRLNSNGENKISNLVAQLPDLFAAPNMRQTLQENLGASYVVYDWSSRHGTFFSALKLEKTMMFIILSLIIAVATFNILSTLVMVVTDKQADIAILRTIGATPGMIVRIFMVQGCIIGFIGTVLGFIGGITLALNVTHVVAGLESLFGHNLIAENVYFLDHLPSVVEWSDVIKICLMSLALSFISTLYPAWRAARIQPAEALRYE
jgi:lipoprotein-releasing system permease protein